MNTHRRCRKPTDRYLGLILGFTLLVAAGAALADNLNVNTFDSNITGIDWPNSRSYIYIHEQTWDGSQDAAGDPNSGSMYLTLHWPLASDPNWNSSWNDVQIAFGTPQITSSDYINFECDIKVDLTNSFAALDGSCGALEL